MKAKQLKKRIEKLWSLHKKDVDKVVRDAKRLTKQGERYIMDKSAKGKVQLEIMALNLQKEKLCYELGKAISRLTKNKWAKSKKALNISGQIRSLNTKIGQKKRSL
ncbi:MAG: hypothetical protein ABH954_03525 [Candidatus Omnitrophota bacterium]